MDLKPAKSKEAKSYVIFHFNFGQVDSQATTLSRDQPADPPQALYCPLGALFEPVHFTKYPPNSAYTEFNLENILLVNPLARTRETKTIGQEGKWYIRPPRLFKDKYNYLSDYFVIMNLPLAPRPDRLMKPTAVAETTSTCKEIHTLHKYKNKHKNSGETSKPENCIVKCRFKNQVG
ncbi:hypothetical protein DSO57_1035422 [Entomophthora muscae]|uniref:Uncharacterized protein n=1 Tax=Entomophthora muscae TaxID=34485 RepID=A0ACC2TLZ5_9FUNG|nr:hypothetical protein DSO57_1035422 [Entomophthora muscae]